MKETSAPTTWPTAGDLPAQPERRPTGPLPKLDTRMTAVMLEEEMIEWGKRQEGGLSATVRRLIRMAMENQQVS